MLYSFIALGILLILSAFFSGTETAYTSLSTAQIHQLRSQHPGRGRLVAHLTEHPDILLTTVLIGNNLANIGASTLAADITAQMFGRGALSITTGLLTLFVLIFGEVTPKQLAIFHNDFWALHTARLIYLLSLLLRPVIIFISGASRLITRLSRTRRQHQLSLESILNIVRHGEMTGVIESFQGRMVKSLFKLNDVPVSAILTHRTQVVSVEKQTPIARVFETCIQRGFSRLPVYDKDPERIVGVALFRDVGAAYQLQHGNKPVKTVMLEPVFVSENRKVEDVFNTLKRENLNMVIVLDEYGGLAGIVTMEDVVEELLGEMYDENELKLGEKILALNDNEYRVFADTPVYQFNEYFAATLPEDSAAQTIGGYLTNLLGRIPTSHQIIDTPCGRFVVERMARKHIITLRYRPTAGSDTESEES
ncbi:hemolysin family protein [Spirochaeta africana]|uniref:CBS domain-containing protein n=1 Tax=Spirochaeta africana (strain ATCC 700263 / DSM 8902 / Z-7692) TaxID=889378 RepID=H9UMC2_SPIAZ|nr:hemolysin family protein [Spirochaeta africana]AFG38665.1 CBS domain-containing protein [Spirochaeta africana DSM 8902]